ncbi:flavin reductase family protein [Candidatus Woesearchaeota archaeon]|nr:flavin reductase family protein [Candidatus Woesearchaeota archaeon]MBW3005600.1 flavin reductase family protein [Candidatus Woesearchaeota archaeon]
MVRINNPRQTVLISCRGPAKIMGVEEHINDILPLDWHAPASYEPRKYIILVSKQAPALERIRATSAFVVNFMPYELKDKIIACGKEFKKDEFKEVGLTEAPSEKLIDCPRIKEAIAWLECEVEQEVDVGDHILLIGKVLHAELMKETKRPFHIDGEFYTTTVD